MTSSAGRYMAYSPSPSSHHSPSPHLSGLRSASSFAALNVEQEKYLSKLTGERQKLSPFLPILPNCCRLIDQGTTKLENLDTNIGSLTVKLTNEDLKEIFDAAPIDGSGWRWGVVCDG